MSKAIVISIFEFPAEFFPKPEERFVKNVHMDTITDMGVRTFINVVWSNLKIEKDTIDFEKHNWEETPMFKAFPVFEKHKEIVSSTEMWIAIKRPNATSAYGLILDLVKVEP